ncbi:MAG: nicotinamide-nucleotide amidohydrolase family protein [Pseudomonadota bacterium]
MHAARREKLNIVMLSKDPHLLFSRVGSFQKRNAKVRIEACLSFPDVRVGIFPAEGGGIRPAGRGGRVAAAVEALTGTFSPCIVSLDGKSLPERIVRVLAARKMTLACAESCTGGTIANLVTMVPGSSKAFLAGIVAYDNEVKERLLGVKAETLARRGAVSAQVVGEMLAGAQRAAGASCAIATSGIAGPTGATAGKPVGLVCIGAAAGGRRVIKKHWLAAMDRGSVKMLSAQLALKLLLDMLEKK